MMIDYQSVIDVIVQFFQLAMPMGIILGFSEWILNTFFGFVFGKRYIRGE